MKRNLALIFLFCLLLVSVSVQNNKSDLQPVKEKAAYDFSQMKYTITHKGSTTIVGMTTRFSMPGNTIGQLWEKFDDKAASLIKHKRGKDYYGISLVEPSDKNDTLMTYIAGIEVSKAEKIPEGYVARVLPEAEYVVFDFQGELEEMPFAFGYIFSKWLPQSGYTFANQDVFELYKDKEFHPGKPGSTVQIWVPVLKKN
jgi:predicted transcriptional regulator YdeE